MLKCIYQSSPVLSYSVNFLMEAFEVELLIVVVNLLENYCNWYTNHLLLNLIIKYSLISIFFEVRIEVQRPLVHNSRMMRSVDNCRKGNLPKL